MDFSHLDDPEPRPPTGDALARVLTTARARRRRRRQLAGAAATAMVTVVAVIAASALRNDHRVQVAVTDTPTTDAQPAVVAPPSTETTTPPSTTAPKPTATTAARPPTIVPRPTTTTGPLTTTERHGECRPSDLTVSAIPDHGSYARAANVTLSITVRNHTNQPCIRPTGCMSRFASVADRTTVVWDQPDGPPGTCVVPEPVLLQPGESFVYATVVWDQHTCQGECASTGSGRAQEGDLVPPGTYHGIGHVYTADGARIDGDGPTFTIR